MRKQYISSKEKEYNVDVNVDCHLTTSIWIVRENTKGIQLFQ